MKVNELKKLLENMNENDEVVFHVYDFEYDKDQPYELGKGYVLGKSNFSDTFELGINM